MKTPNSKIRALRAKLEALAERGINGERAAAQVKLDRLKARYDFNAPDTSAADLFAGTFQRSSYAVPILTAGDCEIANSIKWAIENRTGIGCTYQNGQLAAQATPTTARTLEKIAGTIADSFAGTWAKFCALGALASDRQTFFMGLYDGMMNEARAGTLPSRIVPRVKKARCGRKAITTAPALAVHPYSVGLKLGGQIRFCVPLDHIEKELETMTRAEIAQ